MEIETRSNTAYVDADIEVAESLEQRKARIRSSMLTSFEEGVRSHFLHHPCYWTVKKVGNRCWRIMDMDGTDRGACGYETKRAAVGDLGSSRYHKAWVERTRWYLGQSRDIRKRQLAADERLIVRHVVAALEVREWPAADGGTCYIGEVGGGGFELYFR